MDELEIKRIYTRKNNKALKFIYLFVLICLSQIFIDLTLRFSDQKRNGNPKNDVGGITWVLYL